VEAEHRQHAVVELAIRDLKDQALAHFPSAKFNANAAWTVIACLAHNLLRWTSLLGLPGRTIPAARTLRRRLFALPGRLTRSARRWTLHLPAPLAMAHGVRRGPRMHPRARARRLTTPTASPTTSTPGRRQRRSPMRRRRRKRLRPNAASAPTHLALPITRTSTVTTPANAHFTRPTSTASVDPGLGLDPPL